MTPANAHHLDHSPGIIDDIPTEHKVPDVSSDEDADDDIPVEVHGEKHDEVGDGELTGVDQGSDRLLDQSKAGSGMTRGRVYDRGENWDRRGRYGSRSSSLVIGSDRWLTARGH